MSDSIRYAPEKDSEKSVGLLISLQRLTFSTFFMKDDVRSIPI